jgi:hypothetical protein
MCVPSLKVAKRATPKSMPIAVVALGCAGSTSRSVWMLAYHRPAEQLTVMFLALPRMSRLLRYRI